MTSRCLYSKRHYILYGKLQYVWHIHVYMFLKYLDKDLYFPSCAKPKEYRLFGIYFTPAYAPYSRPRNNQCVSCQFCILFLLDIFLFFPFGVTICPGWLILVVNFTESEIT